VDALHPAVLRLIERTVELAAATGGFGARALRAALDSSPLWGAGRVEDTFNLMGHALRKALGVIAVLQGRGQAAGTAVVAAQAGGGEAYLKSLLELDDGASGVGEIAFGLNYEIDRFTRNILFDEKIGGTMHLALGMGFADLGGLNRSALHLDLICDLRREGDVYADGELVWQDGRFLQEPQATPTVAHVR